MVNVIDSYEDNDLSEYSGDTGSYSTTTSAAYSGSQALQPDADNIQLFRDVSVGPGEAPVGVYVYPDGFTDPGSVGVIFGSPDGERSGYAVLADFAAFALQLVRLDNGSRTVLASQGLGMASGSRWYHVRLLEWTPAGDMTAKLSYFDGSWTVSATDDTYGVGGVGIDTEHHGNSLLDEFYKEIGGADNLTITDDTTDGELTLDWDDNPDAAGFYVYRATAPGSTRSDYSQVADVALSEYTDTGLLDGERYYYRIAPYDSDGEGYLSEEVAGTTPLPAPTNLTLSYG